MWITGDVELPDGVLAAQAEGRLVFFVGAGASVAPPSDLPLFGALAQKLADLARVPYDDAIAIDYFLGSMPDDFDTHAHTRDIITTGGSMPNSTHRALIRLASATGSLRVVTTNFDDHLASAAAGEGIAIADKWIGPALPLGDDFEGLVHLHGSVTRHPRELVLTDQDFGRAYLTAAWATRFLLPMFQRFTVVFVGYSHDDPIMRYLALGLPSGTPRFVFTSADSAHDVKWKRLGVQPVAYPVTGHDHGALVQALEAWDVRARMGQIEHGARVQEIVSAGTALTPVDRDYLVERLSCREGTVDFAKATESVSIELKLEWLRWLESFAGFKQLFESGEVGDASAVLANWFSRSFLAVPGLHGAALQTVQRLGQTFAEPLFTTASFAVEELARADPTAGHRWRALLATSVHGFTAPARSDMLLPFAPGADPRRVSVLRFAVRPFLVLKRRWFVEEPEAPTALPDADVKWNGEEYSLTPQLSAAVQAAQPGDRSLGLALEEALTAAYDLLDSYRGESGRDGLSFSRSAIEPHHQDEIREPIDAIIDALRDFGVRARGTQWDLPAMWWATRRLLFQRIALHLTATDPNLDANTKLEWLLDRSDLYENGLKHETYAVLAASVDGASSEIRERVLQTVLLGPDFPAETPDRDRHIEYGKYNLLVWLVTHAPAWVEAATALEALQQANKDFAPREHPDFDTWMSSGTWGGQLPMEPSEFTAAIRADAPTALADMLARDFSERAFDEPDWDDVLSLLTQAVENDASIGDGLWNEVLAQVTDQPRRADMLRAIVAGWTKADLGSSAPVAVERASTLVSDAEAAHQIGRFLLEQIRMRVDDAEDDSLKGMRAMARALWLAHGSEFSHAEGTDVMSIAPLYLNSWPGSLALYWLTEVDRRWRLNRDDWSGLNEEERESVIQLLDGPPHALDATRPALASQLFFLFAADADFTTAHLLPLFNDDDSARLVWNAFLHHPRYNDRLLSAGLLDAMVTEWDQLGSITDEMIRQQFFGVVASVVSFAGITDQERQLLLDRSVLSENGAYAERFAEATIRFLGADRVDGAAVWEQWLHDHVQDRLNGVPRIATTEELACWADAVPYLDTAIPDGIALFHGRAPGFGEHPMIADFPAGVLAAHGPALIDFFAARARNTAPSGFTLSYRVRRLVDALRSELGDEVVGPLVGALRAKGLLDERDV
ncbi:SIR2 family protein [Agromyces sp. H3Y2-19a]|uniref:SIR2 family protein n=1 Tax=Agromyces chromiiresistens TaxID=3030835 RepID=UPI0023B8EF86|nr:SIR2 family protein [Agromyces chromiiresistens]MDF0512498.1 SIR2 family protein [Agromyces chromiiresistens]